MLVLTRKPGQGIMIGDDVRITLVEVKGDTVRIGIDAPRATRVYRQELYEAVRQENRDAVSWDFSDLEALDKHVSKESK